MGLSPQRKIAYSFAAFSIIVSILVMFWDLEIGIFLLFLGLMATARAIRFALHPDIVFLNDSAQQKLSRHQSERGRTILVQIVDDFGRELPPATVQKLMAEAQAKASPRDTVVGVRYKITDEKKEKIPG